MFDPTGAFVRWFKPVSGGYLYYPSKNAGGKLVTPDEYGRLVAGWQRTAGARGTWTTVGIVTLVIFAWVFLKQALVIPEGYDWVVMVVCGVGVMTRIFWAVTAPRRLVKNRPDVAPPRPRSETARIARSSVNWRLVLFVLIVSAGVFISHLIGSDRTPKGWAWLIGSGLFFVLYLRIAVLKLRDRDR